MLGMATKQALASTKLKKQAAPKPAQSGSSRGQKKILEGSNKKAADKKAMEVTDKKAADKKATDKKATDKKAADKKATDKKAMEVTGKKAADMKAMEVKGKKAADKKATDNEAGDKKATEVTGKKAKGNGGHRRKQLVIRDDWDEPITTTKKDHKEEKGLCFVPLCKTNDSLTEIVRKQAGFSTPHLFSPPQNKDMFARWEVAIGRRDAKLTCSSYVCCLHFLRSDYVQCPVSTQDSTAPTQVVPALNLNSVPSIFPILQVSNFGEVNTEHLFPGDVRAKGLVNKDYILQKYGSQALFENINKPIVRVPYPTGHQDPPRRCVRPSRHNLVAQVDDGIRYSKNEIVFDDDCNEIVVKTEVISDVFENVNQKEVNKSLLFKQLSSGQSYEASNSSRVLKETNRDWAVNLNAGESSEGYQVIQVNPNCTCEQDSEELSDNMTLQFEKLNSILSRLRRKNWIHSFTHDHRYFALVYLEDLENFVTKKKIIIDTHLNVKVLVAEKHEVNIMGFKTVSLVKQLKHLLHTVETMGICSTLLPPITNNDNKFKCNGFLSTRRDSVLCLACDYNAKRKRKLEILQENYHLKYQEAMKTIKTMKRKMARLETMQRTKIEKLKDDEIIKIDDMMDSLEKYLMYDDDDEEVKKKKSKSKKKDKESVESGLGSSGGDAFDKRLTKENSAKTNSVGEGSGNVQVIGVGNGNSSGGLKRRADESDELAEYELDLSPAGQGHDSANRGHDSANRSHDSANRGHDSANRGHDSANRGIKKNKLDILERIEKGARVVHEPVESYTSMKKMTIDDSDGMLVLMIDPDVITVDQTS